jgi:hypothetical protein
MPVQARIDEAQETLTRPSLPAALGAAQQWSEDLDGPWRFVSSSPSSRCLNVRPLRPNENESRSSSPDQQLKLLEEPKPLPIPLPPTKSASTERFTLLQQWEGTILRVGAEELTATLSDHTDTNAAEEQADFSWDEISEDDRALVKPGAVFYCSLGYLKNLETGQISKASRVVFRRLPAWSRRDLKRVETLAESLQKRFGAGHR